MSILQLKYFKALAERGHLTKTAEDLKIAAPSLSASIARLEAEIGCKLFDREGRNIRLNKSGEIYLKYVTNVLQQLEDARKEVHEIAHERNTNLSIAISSPVVWLDALRSFINEYPDIKISHTLLKYDQFKNFSYCSTFDFLITAVSDLTDSHGRWDYNCLLADDKPVIAVYPSHPFAGRKGLRLYETKDEKYIAVSRGFSMRKFFEESCSMSGFIPKIVLECDYILRSSMLTAKYGIIFTTESGARANVLEDAVYVPVIDPPIRRMQVIFYKKSSYLSQAAALFRDSMIAHYQRVS